MAFANRASPSVIASHTDVQGLAACAKVRRTRAQRMRSRTNLSRPARVSKAMRARLGSEAGAREAKALGKIVVSAA